VTTRQRLAFAAVVFTLFVVGVVLAFVDVGVVGFAIVAVAAVLAMGWAFYEVGASEDRDRREGRS
jgi:hypothetical protein